MTDDETAGRADPATPPEPVTAPRTAPVPKRKKPGPYRVPPRDRRHGLLIVNTGDGKGKTTAALGVLLRATGRGMRAGMFQFVKRTTDGGEHRTARRLGVDIVSLGAGCTLGRDDTRDDAAAARAGWTQCESLLAAGTYDVLILDELTLPLTWGWLDLPTVLSALRSRPTGTHVIVTGRDAPQPLIDAADLVTDMRVIKHPYRDQRVKAQAGIDV
jgi:cob(I)alamin adenosyltransferase